MPWTLVLLSVLEIAIAMGYGTLSVHYFRRARGRGADATPRFFAIFWGALGLYGFSEAAWSLAVSARPLPLAVGVTVLHAKVLLAALGFFGLSCYLLRLYTGRGWERPVAAYYAAAYALLLYSYDAAQPVGQEIQAWRGGLLYAHADGLVGTVAPLLLFAPALVAAVAFLLLARRAQGPTRRRVLRLGVALLVFLLGLSLGWLNTAWFWWPLAEKTLAAVALAGAIEAVWSDALRSGAGRRASHGS